MKPTEIVAIICAIAGPIITGLFLIKNTRTLKKIAIEKRLDDQDSTLDDILKEVRETNGKVRGLLEWKDKASETIARHDERITTLQKNSKP